MNTKELYMPLIIIAYVFAHFCMAIFYRIFERTVLEGKIKELLKFNYKIDSDLLPEIYNIEKDTYIHFIERYVVLVMMRYIISAAFFLIFFTNIYFVVTDNKWQICLITIFSFFASLSLYILTCRTENDYADRIESMRH
jgi:hypothetical protein